MGKYFGTDGFRGEANVVLTVEHAFKVGRYLGWYFRWLTFACWRSQMYPTRMVTFRMGKSSVNICRSDGLL